MALEMKIICLRFWLVVAVVLQVFFLPQPVAAQVGVAAVPPSDFDLKTSLRGPLQQRLEAAYPDSYDSGIEIFWEPHDGWISQEVLDWWALRVTDDDFEGVNREAAERMLWRISADFPVFERTHRRRRCAVVGASRNLLGSRYGELIDAHDVIVRVNRAPTERFQTDVGEDTTHHVMWPRELGEWEYDRRAFLLMTPITVDNPGVFDRIITLAEQDLGWDLERVRIIHPGFVHYVHQRWTGDRGGYPSTGFIALMIALHVCDEVDVFGFGADAQGRWDRYYEEYPEDARNFHPVDFEGQLRREMEEKGILKVFRGSRPDPSSRTDAPPRD
jgi:hypothetical protein